MENRHTVSGTRDEVPAGAVAGRGGDAMHMDDSVTPRPFPVTPVSGWRGLFPWLRAGTTRRFGGAVDSIGMANTPSSTPDPGKGSAGGPLGEPVDIGFPPCTDMLLRTAGRRWHSVVRSRQVHGSLTLAHVDPGSTGSGRGGRPTVHGSLTLAYAGTAPGPNVVGDADGHVTRVPGVLLTVTVADCVPVFIADPVQRAVGLLHAGWRGTAGGVVESGIAALREAFGSRPADMALHLGPAICGECYEVGPEVFQALGEPAPSAPWPIDLRRIIRRRVAVSGVCGDRVAVSSECTLCGDGRYFSHRRGDTGRQRAFIGIAG